MRVLLLNQFLPPDPCATGQLALDLGAALVERGHEVHALCSRGRYGGGRSDAPPESLECGVFVHRVAAPTLGRGSLAARAVDCAGLYPSMLAAALRLGRFDACVALTMPPFVGLVGAALRARHGTRLLVWVMDVFEGLFQSTTPVARLLYRQADGVVVLGQAMAGAVEASGADPRRVAQIPNWMPGAPPSPVDGGPMRAEWGLGDEPVFLYSGNHGLHMELPTLVSALGLAARRTPLRAVFVGAGQLRSRTGQMCATLRVPAVFQPPQPLERVPSVLAAGDVHLVGQGAARLGVSEPCKLAAAFACGRPVVHVGPETSQTASLARRAGASVACGDVAGAAAAMVRLARDPALRRSLGSAARACYETELSRATGTARLVGLVESLGRAPAGRAPSWATYPAE